MKTKKDLLEEIYELKRENEDLFYENERLSDSLCEAENKEYNGSVEEILYEKHYDDLKQAKYNEEWFCIWEFEHKKIFIILK